MMVTVTGATATVMGVTVWTVCPAMTADLAKRPGEGGAADVIYGARIALPIAIQGSNPFGARVCDTRMHRRALPAFPEFRRILRRP